MSTAIQATRATRYCWDELLPRILELHDRGSSGEAIAKKLATEVSPGPSRRLISERLREHRPSPPRTPRPVCTVCGRRYNPRCQHRCQVTSMPAWQHRAWLFLRINRASAYKQQTGGALITRAVAVMLYGGDA